MKNVNFDNLNDFSTFIGKTIEFYKDLWFKDKEFDICYFAKYLQELNKYLYQTGKIDFIQLVENTCYISDLSDAGLAAQKKRTEEQHRRTMEQHKKTEEQKKRTEQSEIELRKNYDRYSKAYIINYYWGNYYEDLNPIEVVINAGLKNKSAIIYLFRQINRYNDEWKQNHREFLERTFKEFETPEVAAEWEEYLPQQYDKEWNPDIIKPYIHYLSD